MNKKEKNSTINREITFPIKIGGQNITASPGDSVLSALYYNKNKLNKNIIFNGKRDLIFSKKINELFLIGEVHEVNLGFDELLEQEAYPGLEIKSNNFLNDLASKFLNKFSIPFSGNMNKLFNILYLPSQNKQPDFHAMESVEFISSQILIVGAGIAGLFAASILVNAGLKVVLIERDFILGGIINTSNENLKNWVKKLISDLRKSKNCRILKNTKLIHADHKSNFFAIRKFYHKGKNNSLEHSFVLLKIVAEHAIIATGLKERSIPIIDINYPNIILAGQLQQLIYRFGLTVSNRVIIYTNNNFGWDTAFKLLSLGIEIQAVIDTRENCNFSIACPVFRGAKVIKINSNSQLKSLKILNNNGKIVKIKTSYLIVSGGFDLNLGSIANIIESLKWCSNNLTFIPNRYSANIDILSDFNNIFCTNSLIKNTANISAKILGKYKLRSSYKFPTFEENALACELLQDIDYYKNIRFYLFNKFKDLISPRLIFNHFFNMEINNRFIDLKLNALKSFSNDKLVQQEIKNNLFFDEKENKLRLSFTSKINLTSNHSYNQLKYPYRSLTCNDFYDEIGKENYFRNGWLIPKYFYKNQKETDALSSIGYELSMVNTVGMADQSDLAKIAILGKDAISFLRNTLNLDSINFGVNRFFSVILVKEDKSFFDNLLVLVINKEYILLLLDSHIENEFYNYLSSKLSIRQNQIKCDIYNETDIFQVFSLVGKLADKLIAKKFETTKSLFSIKSKNNIHKFNYHGHDLFLIVQNLGSDLFIDIIINSTCAVKFLEDVYPSLKYINGGLIGRQTFEKIKLDSGSITWKNIKKTELRLPIVTNRFEHNQNPKFDGIDYKIYLEEFIYSKMSCLIPVGLTKNIVKGSNVYHFLNGKKNSLLGKVVFCFYSIKIRKMIAFIFFPKQNINCDLVLVENISKNYQTLCEVKKYNELFS